MGENPAAYPKERNTFVRPYKAVRAPVKKGHFFRCCGKKKGRTTPQLSMQKLRVPATGSYDGRF